MWTDEMLARQTRLRRVAARTRAFRREAGGATTIEYTIAASMLALAVFGSMGPVTDGVKKVFATVTTALGQVQ